MRIQVSKKETIILGAITFWIGLLFGLTLGPFVQGNFTGPKDVKISGFVWVTTPLYPNQPSKVLFEYYHENCKDTVSPACYSTFNATVTETLMNRNQSFVWYEGAYSISVPNNHWYGIRVLFTTGSNESSVVYNIGLLPLNASFSRIAGYNLTCTDYRYPSIPITTTYACFGPVSGPPGPLQAS